MEFRLNTLAGQSDSPHEQKADAHPDAKWKIVMRQGNIAYENGNPDKALRLYLEGIDEAKRLVDLAQSNGFFDKSDPIPALVVSAFNAANIYQRRGFHDQARFIMRCVLILIQSIIANPTFPRELRVSSLQHVNLCVGLLRKFMKQAGESKGDITKDHECWSKDFYSDR